MPSFLCLTTKPKSMDKLLKYFHGDNLAAKVWRDKYQLKDDMERPLEETPDDMHKRMAKAIFESDTKYLTIEKSSLYRHYDQLSHYGKIRERLSEESIFDLLKDFKYIIPGGSTMTMLGNHYQIGSLSNCFVIGQPDDSYAGIMKLREEQVQLMKRRGGVGKDLSSLRPRGARVKNAAKNSTGASSFMNVDSELTREVAQDGRRGALMLTMDIRHPDVLEFITAKQDKTKVTGANISVMLRDDFMDAVINDKDYYLRWPVNYDVVSGTGNVTPYNELVTFHQTNEGKGLSLYNGNPIVFVKRIKAKEYWDTIISCAHDSAEPGIMFIDNHWNNSPDGVYPNFRGVTTNPCGEIFMGPYDACRLIAVNLFSFVDDPFTENAKFDREKFYQVCYEQLRIADDIIDLEVEAINNILEHIGDRFSTEYRMWEKIKETTYNGRRTGCGITGLGDMLAALNILYGSPLSMEMIEKVMTLKMSAELDAGIDLAILRGAFPEWNKNLEFIDEREECDIELLPMYLQGANTFYVNLNHNFSEDTLRMHRYGRRNISWSTVAPTGTISMMTQTTSGIEPLFNQYYIRRVKMMNKEGTPDHIDPNDGEWYREHLAIHPKIYQWYKELGYEIPFDEHPIGKQKEIMEASPWANSTSDKIDPETRVLIQSIIQRYTTHSISSTVNLPEHASIHNISNIYKQAWANSLKGITVYRDKSRAGVIVNKDEFTTHNAPKRGKELESNFHQLRVKGEKFGVVVGLKDGKPFEVFAFRDEDKRTKFMKGITTKQKKGSYIFTSSDGKYLYDCLQCLDNVEEKAATLYGSMLLRHGAPIPYIIKTMKKVNENIVSFSAAITRVLAKYVPDGVKSAESCPRCGSKLTFENGCAVCKECGYDAC